jgi:branched-chain amino acid transport system permease protein
LLVLQVIVNGVLLGGLYACISMGFSLIWGVMNLINLAHGSMIMLGAYVTFLISTHTGIDPFATIPASAAVLFAVGYALQKYLINLVVQVSIFITLIFTFGLDLVLINLNLALFSADIRSLNLPYAQLGLDIAGIGIPYGRLCVFAAAVVLTLCLHLFLNHTRIGGAIKATSFDREAASLAGVDIARIYALIFAIGAMMAGIAGSLITVVYSFSPVTGDTYTMKSFVVVILGGLGSVPGAIFGGILLGVVENLASLLLDAGYRDAVGFGLLILVLLVRPQGLIGKQFFAEVKA